MVRQQQSPFMSPKRRWCCSILTLERREGGLQFNSLKTSLKFQAVYCKFIQGAVIGVKQMVPVKVSFNHVHSLK